MEDDLLIEPPNGAQTGQVMQRGFPRPQLSAPGHSSTPAEGLEQRELLFASEPGIAAQGRWPSVALAPPSQSVFGTMSGRMMQAGVPLRGKIKSVSAV